MSETGITRRRLVAAPALLILAPPRAGRAGTGGDALAQPGVHALMRHALAPGTGDPPGFRLDDPATQRNLDDRGRAQARAAGAALRAAGARFDPVLSSAWARCVETATLMEMGPVRVEPALNSFFGNRAAGPAARNETLALLRALPEGAKALLVTHQVNFAALTGAGAASGEIIGVRLRGDGPPETVARMRTPFD